MKIEKNDMVMVYDGGGTVPHCKYTGRFGDLTAYWQEIVSDAVYLFRLGERCPSFSMYISRERVNG